MRTTELSDEYIRLEILKMASHRVDTHVHAGIMTNRTIKLSIDDYFDGVRIFEEYVKFGIIPKEENK